MNDLKWESGMTRDRKESGLCRRTIALVDASMMPSTNNRSAKMGAGNCTFATAILGYDPRTKQVSTGDGTGSNLMRFPFEPDNWMFRTHGKGFDNVWAVRLVVDKTNKAQEKKNRSTHFIDQGKEQRYGNAADLFWIVQTDVSTDFGINGAGYHQSGSGTRDALALSIARNEGFCSDGESIGQLGQALTFCESADADQPTPGGGGKPVKTPGGGKRVPTPGGGGGPSDPNKLPPIPSDDEKNRINPRGGGGGTELNGETFMLPEGSEEGEGQQPNNIPNLSQSFNVNSAGQLGSSGAGSIGPNGVSSRGPRRGGSISGSNNVPVPGSQ